MENQELVNELRNLLPPKVDYAKLVGAESFSHGCCYVWEDPEPYIIENAANIIKTQQSEIDRLKKENEQLRKLLEISVADLVSFQKRMQELTRTAPIGGEHKCVACNEKDCQYCGFGDYWQWQHADKLKGLIEV